MTKGGEYLRLRQICLVARDLEFTRKALTTTFGVKVCIRDPNVGKHGLKNVVMPFGNTFLEVISPSRAGTSAGRYLDRLSGDGGYMVILDCNDQASREAHLQRIGVRIPYVADYPDGGYRALHLHPKDVGATLLSIDRQGGGADLGGSWHPAGSDWQQFVRRTRIGEIRGVELQSLRPQLLAKRWSEILERPLEQYDGQTALDLDNASLRFVAADDARGETMRGLDIAVTDRAAVHAAAAKAGLIDTDGRIQICGICFTLLD